MGELVTPEAGCGYMHDYQYNGGVRAVCWSGVDGSARRSGGSRATKDDMRSRIIGKALLDEGCRLRRRPPAVLCDSTSVGCGAMQLLFQGLQYPVLPLA